MTLIGIALCGLLFVALFGRTATQTALDTLGRLVVGIAGIVSVIVFVAVAYQKLSQHGAGGYAAQQGVTVPVQQAAEAVLLPDAIPSLYVPIGIALCGLLLFALVGKEKRRTILGIASVIGAVCLAAGAMGVAAYAFS